MIIGIPEDQPTAADWKATRGVPFTVVTGRAGTPHATLGLTKRVFGAMQQSGSVLIDSHGVVRHAHSATVPVASYDKKGIAAAVDALEAETGSALR